MASERAERDPRGARRYPPFFLSVGVSSPSQQPGRPGRDRKPPPTPTPTLSPQQPTPVDTDVDDLRRRRRIAPRRRTLAWAIPTTHESGRVGTHQNKIQQIRASTYSRNCRVKMTCNCRQRPRDIEFCGRGRASGPAPLLRSFFRVHPPEPVPTARTPRGGERKCPPATQSRGGVWWTFLLLAWVLRLDFPPLNYVPEILSKGGYSKEASLTLSN